jgi:hypothetical protein
LNSPQVAPQRWNGSVAAPQSGVKIRKFAWIATQFARLISEGHRRVNATAGSKAAQKPVN